MNERDRPETNLDLDRDVHAVLEFMIGNVPTTKLTAVAAAIEKIAPILWGHYSQEPVWALRLQHDAIAGYVERTPPISNELHPAQLNAGGDSAEAVAGPH